MQYLCCTSHIYLPFPFDLFSFDRLLSCLNFGPLDVVTIESSVIVEQGEVLDLGQTADWVLSSSKANISVPATVPGGVYSDLREVRDGTQCISGPLFFSQAGVLNQDLYYRFNDVEYRYLYCHDSSIDIL